MLHRLFSTNIGADGRFKPAAELRAEFDALLGSHDPKTVVHQCGSGVSALPNLIAMEIAGYAPTALVAGSWSEWCSAAKWPAPFLSVFPFSFFPLFLRVLPESGCNPLEPLSIALNFQ